MIDEKEDSMSKEAWAHNEWLRLYIEESDQFQAEFRTIIEFLRETKRGATPSYGENCAAYLAELVERAPESDKERVDQFAGYDPDWS